MTAVIKMANKAKGLYIFQREDDYEYGYFELIGGGDLEVDDILVGDFTALASEIVKIAATGEWIEVFIEDYCSLQVAKQRVFR